MTTTTTTTSSASNFDQVFAHVGGKNRFQWILFFVCSLQEALLVFHHLGFVLLGAVPDHWCNVKELSESGWSPQEIRNFTSPLIMDDKGGSIPNHCEVYDLDYSQVVQLTPDFVDAVSTWNVNKTETRKCSTYYFDESIYISTLATQFDLVCDRRPLVATIQSSYMGGILLGSLILPAISDKAIGRRRVTLVSIGIVLVSSVAAAFATSYWVFVSLRFILAFGVAGTFQNCYVLMLEYCDEDYRRFMGVVGQLPFTLGYMIMPGIGYFIRDWPTLQLTFALSGLPMLSYIWLLPESSRWLASHGKSEEALKILHKVARTNKRDPLNEEEVLKILKKCNEVENPEKTEKPSFCNIIWQTFKNFWIMLKTPGLRCRALVIWSLYFAVALVYYGLSLGSVRLSDDPYLLIFLAGLVEIPGSTITATILKKVDRKWFVVVTFFLSGICVFGLAFCPTDYVGTRVSLAMSGKLFNSAAFVVVYMLACELFPTTMRTTGLGSSVIVGRFGSMAAPFIVDINASSKMDKLPIIVFGLTSFGAALLSMCLPNDEHALMPDKVVDIIGKKHEPIELELTPKSEPPPPPVPELQLPTEEAAVSDHKV